MGSSVYYTARRIGKDRPFESSVASRERPELAQLGGKLSCDTRRLSQKTGEGLLQLRITFVGDDHDVQK